MAAAIKTVSLHNTVTNVAIAMALSPVQPFGQFVWNFSPSAPAGLYRVDKGTWSVGDRVVVAPSETLANDLDARGILPKGRFLIKRVAGAEGSTVCRLGLDVSVANLFVATARTAASGGEQLPSWEGCIKLGADQVFLLGDTPNSYDGRYFGVTSVRDIKGRAVMFLPFGMLAAERSPLAVSSIGQRNAYLRMRSWSEANEETISSHVRSAERGITGSVEGWRRSEIDRARVRHNVIVHFQSHSK